MTEARPAPGRLESSAAATAGVAFAIGAILVRSATVVPAGIFDGAAVVSLAWGVSLVVHRVVGAAAATILRGASLAAGAVLGTITLAPPFDGAALPLAAWLVGGALLQARALRWGALLAGAGLTFLAMGVAAAWVASPSWPEAARLRAALAASAALSLTGLAARLVLLRRRPRLAPSAVGVLLFAAIASIYVAYRPLVATRVANLPLYEWTLGVGAAMLMLARLRRTARDAAVAEAWTGSGHKHRHEPTPAYDPRMAPLATVVQRYLDTGDGFEEYRAALLRLAPGAPPPFRKTLQGARPVQGRGRAGKAARRDRLATHDALMELTDHGHAQPHVRSHP